MRLYEAPIVRYLSHLVADCEKVDLARIHNGRLRPVQLLG